jgi:hypothetical protein
VENSGRTAGRLAVLANAEPPADEVSARIAMPFADDLREKQRKQRLTPPPFGEFMNAAKH